MIESPVDRLLKSIDSASSLYYRLVLVVAPSGEGKTEVLNEVSKRLNKPIVNINLELSRLLIDLTQRQRILQLPRIMEQIVNGSPGDIVLLDNIELLFDPTLSQDPLRLLQDLSRNRTVVCSWNGTLEDEYITYAAISHPEYRRYHVSDFLVVAPHYKQNGGE
ncbi:MAG: BREX-3 system P-loop-containing protein BrxF [Dehalococcoidales bacterium]|nr:BREX-3 system P-loop-containing protein BrxF [Dehalococcoidales bacterium]